MWGYKFETSKIIYVVRTGSSLLRFRYFEYAHSSDCYTHADSNQIQHQTPESRKM